MKSSEKSPIILSPECLTTIPSMNPLREITLEVHSHPGKTLSFPLTVHPDHEMVQTEWEYRVHGPKGSQNQRHELEVRLLTPNQRKQTMRRLRLNTEYSAHDKHLNTRGGYNNIQTPEDFTFIQLRWVLAALDDTWMQTHANLIQRVILRKFWEFHSVTSDIPKIVPGYSEIKNDPSAGSGRLWGKFYTPAR